jgi:hypothetical protein
VGRAGEAIANLIRIPKSEFDALPAHLQARALIGKDSTFLLPKMRAAASDALLVADGTSCRHQIRDGAQRGAVHVARVLERALAAGDAR